MRILMIRNAEHVDEGTGWPKDDAPLSDAGKVQAQKIANDLIKRGGNCSLISSDYLRAKQTIEPLAKKMGKEILIDKNLRSFDVGPSMFGISEVEARRRLGESVWNEIFLYPDPTKRYFPGGETLQEEAERVWRCLDENMQKYASQYSGIVLSTHLTPIQGILCKICEMPLKNLWTFKIRCGSITSIVLKENRWYIKEMGFIPL